MQIRKFVGRDNELSLLADICQRNDFVFFILYGRRRVGKTMLLKRFLEDRDGMYFLCDRRGTLKNLERFSGILSRHLDLPRMGVRSFTELFEETASRFGQREITVVMDEFPYLVKKDGEITSEFQYVIDEILSGTRWKLIICGSSMSVMTDMVLSRSSPLYGRRTGQLKLPEFRLRDIRAFFPGYTFEDVLRTYGCLGGIPRYLCEFDPELGFEENVIRSFFSPGNFLYEEVNLFLRDELRAPETYMNILEQMSTGLSKLTDRANGAYIASKDVYKYLQVLKGLDLVERTVPVTKRGRTKKSLYGVRDNYFRFWFRFILPQRQHIEFYDPRAASGDFRMKYEYYMGPVLEEIMKGLIPVLFPDISQRVGRWWYRDREIDVVGLNEVTGDILLCECKWSGKPVGKGVAVRLQEKARHVDWRRDSRRETYVVVSKSGFTPSFWKYAEEAGNVHGYDLEDLERELM